MLYKSNKKLSMKQYQTIRIIVAALLAVAISQSIILGKIIIPLFFILLAFIVLTFLRKHVDGVIADERDYEVGGHAARWAIQIYAIIGVIIMIPLFALRAINPFYEVIASTLAYSICLLMFIYSALFRFYGRMKFNEHKKTYIVIIIILSIVAAVGTVRVFSGEDDWICKDGAWVAHGRPSFPAPTVPCEQ